MWSLLAVHLAEGAAPSNASPRIGEKIEAIRVVLVGSQSAATLAERLSGWFGPETRVLLEIAPSMDAEQILGPKEQPGASVWIELRSTTTARLYFVVSRDGEAQRFLLRDLDLDSGLDELGYEQLTQVVYSSVLALWQGQAQSPKSDLVRELSASVGQVEASARPHATTVSDASLDRASVTATPRASLSVTLGLGYGLSLLDDAHWSHGPELRASVLCGRARTRVGAYWSARYLPPIDISESSFTLTLTGGRSRLGAMVEYLGSDRIGIQAGAGFGVDVVRYDVTTGPAFEALPGATDLVPLVALALGARFLHAGKSLALHGELDIPLKQYHYDVSSRAGTYPVFSPWRLGPGLLLSLGFDFPAPRAVTPPSVHQQE